MKRGVYVKLKNGVNMLLMCIYVDDLLITGSNLVEIEMFKNALMIEFEMTDLGRLKFSFLGMEFFETDRGIILHQHKYAIEVLKKFSIENYNTAITPIEVKASEIQNGEEEVDNTLFKQMVDSLSYLYNNRPYICFAIGVIIRHMHQPKRMHLLVAKRVLRYVKGTTGFGVLFPKNNQVQTELASYSASDWCGVCCYRRSTSGFLF